MILETPDSERVNSNHQPSSATIIMVNIDIGTGPLEIWLECDGKRLEEHNLRSKDGPEHQECYVASEVNQARTTSTPRQCPMSARNSSETSSQEFEIIVKTLYFGAIENVVDVTVDGVQVRSSYVCRGAGQKMVLRGALTSASEERR